MIKPTVYIDVVTQLNRKLRDVWRPYASKLMDAVSDHLDKGDYAAAYDTAATIDLGAVGDDNKQAIKYMLKAVCMFGALTCSPGKTAKATVGDAFLSTMADNLIASIRVSVSASLYKHLMQLIADAEERVKKDALATSQKADEPKRRRKVRQGAKGKKRYLRERVSFAAEGDAQLQLVSELHSSRLAVWGFTAEANLLGLETYKLSAVLDGRTSPFCRAINDKVFSVKAATDSIHRILGAAPEDVKTLQPWPKQNKVSMAEYAALTAEELTERGLHIPPFHPSCRTLLMRVGGEPNLARLRTLTPPPTEDKTTSTVSSFSELGVTATQEDVNHWNAHIGLSPVLALAKLSGFSPENILGGALGKLTKTISVAEDGTIRFKYLKTVDKAKLSASSYYDPYTAKLYVDYVRFKGADVKQAHDFLRQTLEGAANVATSIGAAGVVLTVGGETGAYAMSRAGVLPSQSEWASIKESILQNLKDGLYPDVLEALTDEQLDVLEALLALPEPDTMKALSHLPFKVGGDKVGKVLLKGVEYEGDLNLEDFGD